jgi:hypothetical protein
MDKVVFSIDSLNPGIVDIELLETIKGIRRVSKQRLAFNDFMGVMQDSLSTENKLRIGKLPNGFYDGNIDGDGRGFQCLIVIPEDIKTFIYYDKTYIIPFPTLAFNVVVRNGVLKHSEIYALASGQVTDKSELCNYPFGNVYHDAKICWGSNCIKGIKTFRDVEMVVSTFFGSSTNDDMWRNGHSVEVSKDDPRCMQRGLLESLQNKTSFPKNILVKSNCKLGEVLKV